MGFEIYRIETLDGNHFALSRMGPLSLGGAKGILARKIPALAAMNEEWGVSAEEILGWAGFVESGALGIFFDLHVAQEVNFFELVRVSGRTVSLVTDALFHFKVACVSRDPAKIKGADGEWIVPDWRENPVRFEHLRLAGGTKGGTWAWSEPPQSASATVL